MITCPNCNKELADNTLFCDACGTPQGETVACPHCGQQTGTAFENCQNCGTSLKAAPITTEAVETTAPPKKAPFHFSKKIAVIGSAALAFIVVAAILVSLVLGNSTPRFGLYIKDGDLYYTDLPRLDSYAVTSRLFDNSFPDDYPPTGMWYLANMTVLSEDGERLFYPDKASKSDDGFTLFYRLVKKPKKEPVRIDTDVQSYCISKNGKLVTYLKGKDDRTLYQHDLKENDRIAGDVLEYTVSEDGKYLWYRTENNGLYVKRAGKDKEKLDKDVTTFMMSEDGKTVHYVTENGDLYKQVYGKEKQQIDSNVAGIHALYDSGEMYYHKETTQSVRVWDLIDDDMQLADASTFIPEYPAYPDVWDADEWERLYAQYRADMEKWYKKEDRDMLRDELKTKTIERAVKTLCYYDGNEITTLTDRFSSYGDVGLDKPILIYDVVDTTAVEPIKLSEITDANSVNSIISEHLLKSAVLHIAIGKNTEELDEDGQSYHLSSDDSTLYFFKNVDSDTRSGDLYHAPLSGDTLGEAERYDRDVYHQTFPLGNHLLYFKDVEFDTGPIGDLYMDGEKLDSDVSVYTLTYTENADKLFYLTDFDQNDGGTLTVARKGKTTEIADDVYNFHLQPSGEVLFLQDYNTKQYEGTLFCYKSGKPKKVDDDVSAIIPVYDGNHWGHFYNW